MLIVEGVGLTGRGEAYYGGVRFTGRGEAYCRGVRLTGHGVRLPGWGDA